MTAILLVVGIIGYVIFRQVQGEALHLKRAVLLPAILTVMGFTDLHVTNGAHLQAADITCLVIGTAGSALIGFAFGMVTRLESRGGYLWAQLPLRGLWLWVLLVVWRVIVVLVAGAMHAHIAASTSTLLFSLGVNRLAQAAVIVPRALSMGIPFAPEGGGSGLLSGLVGDSGRGRGRPSGLNGGLPDRDRGGYRDDDRDRYSDRDRDGYRDRFPGQGRDRDRDSGLLRDRGRDRDGGLFRGRSRSRSRSRFDSRDRP